MVVTDKKDLERVVSYLKKAAEKEEDYQMRGSMINVCSTLEQALERHQEDEQHPYLYLEIVKASNLLDQAIDDSCTTDCVHVCQGTCPFITNEDKCRCPRISQYLDDYSEVE